MNLPYTMDINQASSAVLEFKPKVVVPYHYRGKEMSDIEVKSLLMKRYHDRGDVVQLVSLR